MKLKSIYESANSSFMRRALRGPAFWKSKNQDIPVEVIGVSGGHGGRIYMKVKGSDSSIPLDELAFQEGCYFDENDPVFL